MCSRRILGNSFLHLPVNFHSNGWSGFRDFMFTLLENVVSVKSRLKLDIQFYIFACNSFNFRARLRLKYVENMCITNGICKSRKIEFSNILRVTYPLKKGSLKQS